MPKEGVSVYRRHVFVCENVRDNGEACCGLSSNAFCESPVKLMRQTLKTAGLHGKGRIRINRAGCFDRCPLGPVLVIYPDKVWYRYENEDDLAEITQSHLIDDTVVRRLQLRDDE